MEPCYDTRRCTEGTATAKMLPGLILVGIGALFLLDNLHIVFFREWMRYWPAILIAWGIVALVDAKSATGRITGGVIMGVGGILLGDALGYISVQIVDLWPVILIGVGLLLLVQRTAWWDHLEKVGTGVTNGLSGKDTDQVVIFSGIKRVLNGEEFRGGDITLLFGGAELDLRNAYITGDSVTLEINAIFGGAEIRIPTDWSTDMHGAGIFGGFADHTHQPDLRVPGVKRLRVRGAAIFGGVNIKN